MRCNLPHPTRGFRYIMLGLIMMISQLSLPYSATAQPLPKARVLTTTEAPTNFTYAGRFTGTTTEIVRAMLTVMGSQQQLEVYPWSRAYHIALNTPNTVVFTVGRTQQRVDAGFTFIGPVATRVHGVFSRKGHNFISNDKVKHSREPIAVMRDDWRATYLRKEGFQVVEVANHSQGLRMLMNSHINYWLSSDLEAPTITEQWGYRLSDIKMAWRIKEAGSYIALSPGSDPVLIERWRKAYQQIQQDSFLREQQILWRNILNAPIQFTPERGYFIQSD